MNPPRKNAAARGTPTLAAWAGGDLARQQVAVAAEAASALFRGFEAVRKLQEQAAHAALQRYGKAAERLRQPCTPADLLALQADLLRSDAQAVLQHWQQLAAAAMEIQSEIANCGAHLVNSDDVLQATAGIDHWQALNTALAPWLGALNGAAAGAKPAEA